MGISTERKKEIMKKYRRHENDTGSPEVQIALLSERINYLTEHLKENNKDFHSRKGLEFMVSKRKRLLNYLRRKDYDSYQKITKELNLRV